MQNNLGLRSVRNFVRHPIWFGLFFGSLTVDDRERLVLAELSVGSSQHLLGVAILAVVGRWYG